MKEFTSAVVEVVEEDAKTPEDEKYVPFKVDGRELRASQPTDGQMVFMLASLGRGQTDDQRLASIVNIMLSTLRPSDKDYLESRLLDPNPLTRIDPKVIEDVFAYLSEEWFARPTQSPSDSASSPQNDGQNSTPPTTLSLVDSSESDPTDS